jgi:cell division septation protein DedD
VQVATYQRVQLARAELERLRALGEPAFLVTRNGRFSVNVGPFPSKQTASRKGATMKERYHDCFVRSL